MIKRFITNNNYGDKFEKTDLYMEVDNFPPNTPLEI